MTPSRVRVYVSGPITNGGTASKWAVRRHVHDGMRAGQELIRRGFAPLIPHLDQLMQNAGYTDTTYEQWMGVDLAWVGVSDALLRLPGDSAGADREVALARELGIPVFTDIDSLADEYRDALEKTCPGCGLPVYFPKGTN